MSAQHTPGPWAIRDGYGLLKAEIGPADRAVATVWTKQQPRGNDQKDAVAWAEGEANAALIAAAPDLLSAAQKARTALSELIATHDPIVYAEALRALDASIGVATGDQR